MDYRPPNYLYQNNRINTGFKLKIRMDNIFIQRTLSFPIVLQIYDGIFKKPNFRKTFFKIFFDYYNRCGNMFHLHFKCEGIP